MSKQKLNFNEQGLLVPDLAISTDLGTIENYFVVDNERTDGFIKFISNNQKTNFAENVVPNLDAQHFEVFRRLINDATSEIARERVYLPNPSDMFEGENSFEIYRLGL